MEGASAVLAMAVVGIIAVNAALFDLRKSR
jgi:hypothetical protein